MFKAQDSRFKFGGDLNTKVAKKAKGESMENCWPEEDTKAFL